MPRHRYPTPGGVHPDELLKPAPGSEHVIAQWEDEIRSAAFAPNATFTQWREALGQARAPRLLHDCWQQRKISTRTLRRHLGGIWHTSVLPDHWLDRSEWRELFDAAGYTHVRYLPAHRLQFEAGERADPPARPLRVYRGSPAEFRDHWSWTANPDIAARWANNSQHGRVWTALAPPDSVLCRIDRWDQYVIDTHGLNITQHEGNTP